MHWPRFCIVYGILICLCPDCEQAYCGDVEGGDNAWEGRGLPAPGADEEHDAATSQERQRPWRGGLGRLQHPTASATAFRSVVQHSDPAQLHVGCS